jgi:hypothetical protein
LQGNFEDYLLYDVIGFAEAQFNIIPLPGKRSIMGISMGGFGSIHLALKNHTSFRAVAAHSGFPHFDEFYSQWYPEVISANGLPPYEWHPNHDMWTSGWFALAGAFSPNLDNPPYYVDFPLNSGGGLILDVWNRWIEHDPARLAAELVGLTIPKIFFDCGTYDELLFHPINEAFHDHLTFLQIPHTYESFVGGHANLAHLRYPIGIQFVSDAMMDPTSTAEIRSWEEPVRMRPIAPNLVRAVAMIEFSIAKASHARVSIFDVTGRRVATLMDASAHSGDHRLSWDSREHSSGIYFCRVQTDQGQASRKIVVGR